MTATSDQHNEAAAIVVAHIRAQGDATPRTVISACEAVGLVGAGDMVIEVDPPNVILMAGLSGDACAVVRCLVYPDSYAAFRTLGASEAMFVYGFDGSPMLGGVPFVKGKPPKGRYAKTRWAPTILVPRDTLP